MCLRPFSVEHENEKKLFHFSNDSFKSEVAIFANVKIRRKRKNRERTRLDDEIDRSYETKTDKKIGDILAKMREKRKFTE